MVWEHFEVPPQGYVIVVVETPKNVDHPLKMLDLLVQILSQTAHYDSQQFEVFAKYLTRGGSPITSKYLDWEGLI